MTDPEKILQDHLNKNHKDDPTVHLGDKGKKLLMRSTGIIGLDLATKAGGIPVGRQVEIFGKPSTGKSALTYYMMHETHKVGQNCAYFDLEFSWMEDWVRKCIPDFNFNRTAIFNIDGGEQSINNLIKEINSGVFGLIVFDSLGAMLTESEQEEKGSAKVGGQSKLITNMVKKVRIPASNNNCTVVYVNQARDDIASPYNNIKAPGGWGLEHMQTVILELSNAGKFDLKDEMGFNVRATVRKNKMEAPRGKAIWKFLNTSSEKRYGIDLEQDLIDSAMNLRVIDLSGSIYKHASFGALKGKNAVLDFFRSNPNEIENIRREMVKVMREDEGLVIEN